MIEIIDETNNFIIINKAVGIGFHNEKDQIGLLNQLAKQTNQDLFSVHRLDKVTSGLLIFAKNKITAQKLGKHFRENKIHKLYLAIADSKPKKKQGTVKGDLDKARRGAWKLSHSLNNPSITQFFSYSIIPGKKLYILKPLTGKTHQLRVVMKSLGVPILGDTLYGGAVSDRVYLHAYNLVFELNKKIYKYTTKPDFGIYTQAAFNVIEKIGDLDKLKWPKT